MSNVINILVDHILSQEESRIVIKNVPGCCQKSLWDIGAIDYRLVTTALSMMAEWISLRIRRTQAA